MARVRALRTDVIEPAAAAHEGRLFKTTGDGFFVEFASAVQALRCATAIQDTSRAQVDGLRLRIGVHLGEVVPDGDDLMGDGVIIAARLEPLAEPGGICHCGEWARRGLCSQHQIAPCCAIVCGATVWSSPRPAEMP